jgi:quinoprotein glucose dehydrogenase
MKYSLLCICLAAAAQDFRTWKDYGGGQAGAQYTALTQINRSNVGQLKVAWTYSIGDGKKYSFNPVAVDDRLYVMGKNSSIVCLNAATGSVIWTYEPPASTKLITHRGINYWESKDRRERRLFFSSDHALRALDAHTGKLIVNFGDGG